MSAERLVARIGDVAALLRGVNYEKRASSDTPASGLVPLLRATNINGEIDFDVLVYVPASCVSQGQYLRPGDSVIAASSGSLAVVGKSATLRTEWNGTFGAFCYVLRPDSDRIAPFYLSYFLQTSEYRAQVSRLAAGVNINNLKRQHLEDLRIPLCPLFEQHRIVSAIESYFTRLDDAVATLERVQRNLKRYRASVLKAAVEGRLVPTEAELARTEGRDYEPASVLLTRILAERRRRWEEAELAKMKAKGKAPMDDRWKAKYVEPVAPDTSELPELPEGWCWASVDQLTSRITSGSRDWTQYYGRGDSIFLMAQNVRPGQLDLSFQQVIDPPPEDSSCERSQVRQHDLLVTIVGANTGNVCRVPSELARHYVCQSVALMRPVEVSSSHYLDAYLNSPPGQHVYAEFMYGQGRPHLSFDNLRETFVPLPPAAESNRIREAVERQLSVADDAIRSISLEVARVTRLRQSILKWAFGGRLVDQDPTDEPASVLLERIRAEQAASGGAVGRRRQQRAVGQERLL